MMLRLFAVAMLLGSLHARAQDANLLDMRVTPERPAPVTLQNSSFTFQTLPPEAMARPLQLHDVVTVLVDQRSVVQSEGSGEVRKTGAFNSVLTDWLAFDGNSIFPAPQRRGDPTVGGTLNSQIRAETDLEAREALTLEIAVEIVDIRPNGNLVLEGWRTITINEEEWMTYLTGIVPRQSIGPDRRVRDSDVANLRIKKFERGLVRDGYARGWLARLYGKYKAF